MLTSHLNTYAAFLQTHRLLWQFVPFEQADYPWAESQPHLTQALTQLSDEQIADIKAAPEALSTFLSPFLLSSLPREDWLEVRNSRATRDLPFWLSDGVKGRKWQQIEAFSQQCSTDSKHWLEWCAGKGHLGRVLGWLSKTPVTSIEWQEALCARGQQQSTQRCIAQRFVCRDVLHDQTQSLWQPSTHAVALHACGDLHTTLLEQGVAAGAQQLSVSPCCYHLTHDDVAEPMSQAAQDLPLRLSRSDRRLAVQETVTAGARERRKRQAEKWARLLFDQWQRQVRGESAYLPVPSAPDAIIKQGPLAFAQWAAKKKGIPAPNQVQLDYLISAAQARQQQLERMELVQHGFRRALELCLVLDRACFLQEAGYEVALSVFCARQVTPRNLLITARLQQQRK